MTGSPEPHEPELADRSRWSTADRAVVALCLLLALAAFAAKPSWRVLDARMRAYDALEASGGTTWPAIEGSGPVERDQRSEVGLDPWGRPWARWVRGNAPTGPHYVDGAVAFEPNVWIYSSGPDGVMERGGGDDVIPYARLDWRAVTCEQARKLLLVLCALLSLTYAIASRLPRVEPLPVEGLLVVTLAFVPALVCAVGVNVYFDEFLVALAPVLLWQGDIGLLFTLLGSMLLVWSLFIAAVRLRLAPRRPPTDPT